MSDADEIGTRSRVASYGSLSLITGRRIISARAVLQQPVGKKPYEGHPLIASSLHRLSSKRWPEPYLNKLLIKYCEEARSYRGAVQGTFRVGLENTIAPLLPHGKARADEIAGRLGMSPRTLARRLAAEGLTFAGVLNELRADLARRYLQDDDLPISQIAWLLGYQEVSAFTHAFKRWTGKTPREARSQENVAWPESASR